MDLRGEKVLQEEGLLRDWNEGLKILAELMHSKDHQVSQATAASDLGLLRKTE